MDKEKLRQILVELVEKQACDLDVDYWVSNTIYMVENEESIEIVTKNKLKLVIQRPDKVEISALCSQGWIMWTGGSS